MTEKFKGKYRIGTTRLQNWDYRTNCSYFITICTQGRMHFFGEIENKQMHTNEIGQLAEKYWFEIPLHFPFVKLDAFVVMPDHIHGILIIDKKIDNYPAIDLNNSLETGNHCSNDTRNIVETTHCSCIVAYNEATNDDTKRHEAPNTKKSTHSKNEYMAGISPKPGSVSTIIRSYKSAVSKSAHLIHADFAWQPRFYDHIIRNPKSYKFIRRYIINNPSNWKGE